MSLVLKNVNIIDATTPEVRTERNVLVEDGVIRQVTSGPAPDADRVVDLDGAYLLPGLWDVHTHLNKGTYGPESVEEEGLDLVPRVLEYAWNEYGCGSHGGYVATDGRGAGVGGRGASGRVFCREVQGASSILRGTRPEHHRRPHGGRGQAHRRAGGVR